MSAPEHEDRAIDLRIDLVRALHDLAGMILANPSTPRPVVEALHRALAIGAQILDADTQAVRARHWREHPKGADRHEGAGSL